MNFFLYHRTCIADFYRLLEAIHEFIDIAQEIVNAHGGNIFVQSNTEKTVFTVVLPQKQEKDKLSA